MLFSYDMNDSKYAGSRAVHLRDLVNIDEKYNDKSISYFTHQRMADNS